MLKYNSLLCWALFASVFLISTKKSNATCGTPSTICPGFRTQTQGGWGSKPSGNNPGMYLKNNFNTAFPNGVEIGCTNKFRFTSASAISNFLPSGGTPRVLPNGTFTNPTNSYHSNTFSGQVLALAISLGFDNAIPSFGSSHLNLKDLVITSGTFSGWTVQQLFTEANKKIGGCSTSGISISTFNNGVAAVNESYTDGTASGSYLKCPPAPIPCNLSASLQSGAITNVLCNQETNGRINITVAGGTAPIKFLWSNGATTEDISNAGAGTYSVAITDAKGCTASVSGTILQPPVISFSTSSTNVSCKNGSNGSINLTTSGGKGVLTTTWTDGATGNTRSGLTAGQYCYTITDENNCKKSGCITITEPSVIQASLSITKSIACNSACEGSILANVSGGTGNLGVVWSNGLTTNPATGLCAGNYSVIVTDAKGCTTNVATTILEPSSISVTPIVLNNICKNGSTGSINLTTSGGSGVLTTAWADGATGNNRTNLSAGQYCYTVTDENNCKKSNCITITEPALIQVLLSIAKQISCYNVCDGSVFANVSGGTGALSLLWSNATTTNPATGLCAGDYSVTVKDENGCNVPSSSISLVNPTPLVITPTSTPTSSCLCSGTATASVSGGTSPYSYIWSNGVTGINTIANLCLGITTSVSVKDANNCPASYDFGTTKFQGGCNGTEIIAFSQGKRADGSDVDADRSNPDLAKGAPENTNLPGSFYSLGFGGYVVVKIGGGIYNRPGKDLRVVETTYWAWGCTRYEERARVFISGDGITWTDKGQICQDGEIDIWPLQCVSHVKIVDESVAGTFVNEPILADGFDVDGIECIGATSNARMATSPNEDQNSSESIQWISKSLNLYPNPAEDHLNIQMTGATQNEKISLHIFDHVGRTVKSLEMNANEGTFTFNLPTANLKSGIYNVVVKGTDVQFTQKVVKK